MKRILVINVNWLGDVLFSTPAIRTLRTGYPDAYLACLVVPRCQEVLRGNPNLNEVILFDEEGRHRGLAGKRRLISELRSRRFDEVYLLHRSFTRRLLAVLSGIPKRIGYPAKKGGFLLTVPVKIPTQPRHRVDYFLRVIEATGLRPESRNYEFFISESDRRQAGKLLRTEGVTGSDFLVVLNPGGNWNLKRWPKENFARLAGKLKERQGVKVAFTGAAKDQKLIEEIMALSGHKKVINLCGRTTLKQLAAVLERANLMIANDTGPLHIAAAVKTDVIALFGPTSPSITGPRGEGKCVVLWKDVGCPVPCYRLDCPDNRCLKAIRVEDVLRGIDKLVHGPQSTESRKYD